MHSSRMRTARSLPYGGQRPPWTEIPWTKTPWAETPLDRDPPWMETPQTETETETRPHGHTDTCGNITFANFV